VGSSRRLQLVPDEPTTLVDTSVLLDIVMDDPMWAIWSEDALADAFEAGRVVINPIVYTEVSVTFDAAEDLDDALPCTELAREELPYEAAFLVGKAFGAYRARGGLMGSPPPDFYIGAHAAVRSYRLLTRDALRYRAYFPSLELITPDMTTS
jgi:predicted nucleic acid-binding protein